MTLRTSWRLRLRREKVWILILSVVLLLGAAEPSFPLSAELAKKCLQMTMEKYPRPKGYAAYKAGHAGTAKAREEYYRNCLAKDGKIEKQSSE